MPMSALPLRWEWCGHSRSGYRSGRQPSSARTGSSPEHSAKGGDDMTNAEPAATLSTDVLVIGGGPAGTWAAIKAAQAGVDVVLADKGHTGSSGSTASVGTGVWYVDDVPGLREATMATRDTLGGQLA